MTRRPRVSRAHDPEPSLDALVLSAVRDEATRRKVVPAPPVSAAEAYTAGLRVQDVLTAGLTRDRRKAALMLVSDAYERWLTGKSSSLRFGLRDATVSTVRNVRRGYVEAAEAEAFTGREVGPDELFGPLIEKPNATNGGRRG